MTTTTYYLFITLAIYGSLIGFLALGVFTAKHILKIEIED